MNKIEKKVVSVIPGEYTCQVRFKDDIVVTVITDGKGTIDLLSKVAQLPSGDPVDPPEGYVETAEKLTLAAFARKAAAEKRRHKGRVMFGPGVDY